MSDISPSEYKGPDWLMLGVKKILTRRDKSEFQLHLIYVDHPLLIAFIDRYNIRMASLMTKQTT